MNLGVAPSGELFLYYQIINETSFFSNKSIEGNPDSLIKLPCSLSTALQFRNDPDINSFQGWFLWPKAERLGGFKTNPCPGPNPEMGQLRAWRKQAHPVWFKWLQYNSRAWHLRSGFFLQNPFALEGEMLGRRERSHKKQMTNCKKQQLDSACSANTHLIKSIFFFLTASNQFY